MYGFIENSVYFGLVLSIGAYYIGMLLKKKFKLAILNPLLVAIVIVICVLAAGKVDYEAYNKGAKYVTYLLTPATVALAVPMYERLDILKKNIKAVAAGIITGVLTSFVSVLIISFAFSLTHQQYITLLPKSITTAIGMGLSEEIGGISTLTTAAIVLTGIFGNMVGEKIFRLLKIKKPVAKGIALGSAAHAIGTAKAIELGETEGALAGLSIAVSGLITVVAVNVFALIY